MIEPTRLRYGTDNFRASSTTPLRAKTRTSYVVAAALLCIGALVSTKWSTPLPTDAVLDASVKQDDGAHDKYKTFYETTQLYINTSVDPCVDFYEYACGNWLATSAVPSDGGSIDPSFYKVEQDNERVILSIINAKPPVVGEFYEACVNTTVQVDHEGITRIADTITRIHAQNSTMDLLSLAGELYQKIGLRSFFTLDVQADPSEPDLTVYKVLQGGLTLPSREYYLDKKKVDQYSILYAKYVKDLFSVGDLNQHNVTQYVTDILETEKALATISVTKADIRDPWMVNNPYSRDEIRGEFPFLYAYFTGIDKEVPIADVHVIIQTPKFFGALNAVLSSLKLDQWKNYLSFHLVDTYSDALGEYFRRASHEFHGPVRGLGSLTSRAQFCVDTTTAYLGAQIGEYYIQKVLTPEAKASAQTLIDQLEESMSYLLPQVTWLDDATYAEAREKLEHVHNFIGGPDAVPELPFEIKKDRFFENLLQLKQHTINTKIQGVGKRVDNQGWGWDMSASTVNANYYPSANKMVFPAAILQSPLYNADSFPPAANYARIGMFMGHELSHGFDDQGRDYDAKGRLRKWWSPTVTAEYERRAQCLASQYSSFPIVTEGQLIGNVDGHLTLGENIADNGGLHLSYDAYQRHKNTPHGSQEEDDRTFFVAFAQMWCEKQSLEYSEAMRHLDPHSPGRWRTNGPVMNFAPFAETFQCAVGTPMNPTKRCIIW